MILICDKATTQTDTFATMAANGKATSIAKDLFEDMGRQVEGMKNSTEAGDDDQRVVDEIESLCMNCHADVSASP